MPINLGSPQSHFQELPVQQVASGSREQLINGNIHGFVKKLKFDKPKENMPELSKWGIPRTGYLVPRRDTPRAQPNTQSSWETVAAAAVAAVTWFFLGGLPPPQTPSLSRPAGLQDWLLWLSDSQDGCPVYWFDRVTARKAVQFNGLIEWQPGWPSSSMVWLNDSQDGCPVYWFDWVTARMAGSWNGLSFSESENENISFQGTSYKGPFQKVTSTK